MMNEAVEGEHPMNANADRANRTSFRSTYLLLAAMIVWLLPASAESQPAGCPAGDAECAASVAAANAINDELDNGRIHEMWDRYASNFIKSKTVEDVFVAQVGLANNALSVGVNQRTIIQESMAVDSASNLPYYGRMYSVKLSNG